MQRTSNQIQYESKHPLQKNKGWSIWWRMLRPHTLTAGFIPVIVGTSLALPLGVNFKLFLILIVASLFIQTSTNLFNEYYDFKRGLDTEKSIGIGGTIVRDGIAPENIFKLSIACLLPSIVLTVYISYLSSWWLMGVILTCIAVGYYYSGGPYPIAYTPFGEFTAGLFMGSILLLISFYIQTGTVTMESVLISIPVMVLTGGILLANNIRDLEGDKENGRQTLAILIGRSKAIFLLSTMFVFSYLWILALILFGISTIWLLLVLISIPKAVQTIHLFKNKTMAIQLMPAMRSTAQLHTIFGFLLMISFVLGYFV